MSKVRSILFSFILCAALLLPSASVQAQVPTTIRVLVYFNIDEPTWFNYTIDECAANVNLKLQWKPDAYPWTQTVYRDTPNVSGVQGFNAYYVCSAEASFSGAGTLTIVDVDPDLATTTWSQHYNNSGTQYIRLRVTATSGE